MINSVKNIERVSNNCNLKFNKCKNKFYNSVRKQKEGRIKQHKMKNN